MHLLADFIQQQFDTPINRGTNTSSLETVERDDVRRCVVVDIPQLLVGKTTHQCNMMPRTTATKVRSGTDQSALYCAFVDDQRNALDFGQTCFDNGQLIVVPFDKDNDRKPYTQTLVI